jgi:quercetin dioxygenase-like cupin family protein
MFMAIIGVSLALIYRPTAQAQAAAPQEGSQAPYFAAADVEKAFEKNAVIYEEKESFRVSASRREKPGEAEVHAEMTDIFYVLDGTATFVTGGKVVEPRTASAGEIRGASIQGGETRTLGKGDVIVIPAGTPHWFKGVQGTFRNLVVKVRKK